MMLAILLATLSLPQEAPAPPPESEWKRLDAIFLVVNEEVLTYQDFYREAARLGASVATAAEEREVIRRAWVDSVSRLLKVQGGKDLGFDPKVVERYVEEEMESTVERAGSVGELGAALARIDMAPEELRETKEESIYRQLWEGSVDGRTPGPNGRAYVDRYVRPGRLRLEYDRREARVAAQAGKQTVVTLQHLIVSNADAGGAKEALELARSLRQRIDAGEDFDALVEQAGVAELRPTRGIDQPQDLARLIDASTSPEVADFLRTAKEGDVSQPIGVRMQGELKGFRLLKILELEVQEVEAPPRPAFADGSVQAGLRQAIEDREQVRRRDRALQRLLDAAHVWPPEAFGRAREVQGGP